MTVDSPGDQPRTRQAAVPGDQAPYVAGGLVISGEGHVVNVYTAPNLAPSFTGLLSSTVFFRNLDDTSAPPDRIDITAFPTRLLRNPAHPYEELGVEVLAELNPQSLVSGAFAVCWANPNRPKSESLAAFRGIQDRERPQLYGPGGERDMRFEDQWEEVLRRASYLVYGDVALVEESPVRRTSPAAIEASKLASRVLIGGTGSTAAGAGVSALVHSAESGPMVMIVGASVTLVLAIAGGGIVMLWHWLGKRLKI